LGPYPPLPSDEIATMASPFPLAYARLRDAGGGTGAKSYGSKKAKKAWYSSISLFHGAGEPEPVNPVHLQLLLVHPHPHHHRYDQDQPHCSFLYFLFVCLAGFVECGVFGTLSAVLSMVRSLH
jgi:hypothetical protein